MLAGVVSSPVVTVPIRIVERSPRGRICTTKDLGCAAVYLCSDAAEFVSGQVLCVDGGLTAKQ